VDACVVGGEHRDELDSHPRDDERGERAEPERDPRAAAEREVDGEMKGGSDAAAIVRPNRD